MEGGCTPEAGAMPAQRQAAALQGQPQRQQWLWLRQFGPSALRILFTKYPVVVAHKKSVTKLKIMACN